MFNAIWIAERGSITPSKSVQLATSQLEARPIRLRVDYSSINYKDALAITGQGPVVRQFPMIPGIDAIGEILESDDPRWPVGSQVIVTGWGLGERYWGGLAEQLSAEPEWLTALPNGLSAEQAALIGTAGLTAMLAVCKLESHGVTPEQGPIVVTGASGGVGSFNLWLLAQLGYQVIAVTGDSQAEPTLRQLGATQVLPRSWLAAQQKPLLSEQWAAAIDVVGSTTLAHLLAGTQRGGVIVACGMAQGLDLSTSVAPFILRGITLAGIDSVYCAPSLRAAAWQRLAKLINQQPFAIPYQVIDLGQAQFAAQQLLTGGVRGRIVVRCSP